MHPDTLIYRIDNRVYVNLTNRCSLACEFCPKQSGQYCLHEYDLTLHSQPRAEQVIAALERTGEYEELVFCGYGESTFRLPALLEIGRYARARGRRVRLNTDGLGNLVHKRNILPDLSAAVDALSISLNAQNEQVYNRHCQPSIRGSYQALREFIAQAPDYFADVTVTAINGLEGVDIAACADIARQVGVQFRARQLDVLG